MSGLEPRSGSRKRNAKVGVQRRSQSASSAPPVLARRFSHSSNRRESAADIWRSRQIAIPKGGRATTLRCGIDDCPRLTQRVAEPADLTDVAGHSGPFFSVTTHDSPSFVSTALSDSDPSSGASLASVSTSVLPRTSDMMIVIAASRAAGFASGSASASVNLDFCLSN